MSLHLGLAVSILHLGRPLGAWRFFLGLRTSWMSREILAFLVFSMMATLTVGAMSFEPARAFAPWIAGVTAMIGLAGVFISAMIYIDTRRPFWAARLTIPKFFGTTFVMGSAASAVLLSCFGTLENVRVTIGLAMLARVVLMVWESMHEVPRATRTMLRLLPWSPEITMTNLALSMAASVAAMFTAFPIATFAAAVVLGSSFAGSLMERYSFFTTCPTPRMPGGVSA
jgi:DMSO reductase anchor subunit